MNVCMNVLYVSGGYLLKSVASCKLLFFQVVRKFKMKCQLIRTQHFFKEQINSNNPTQLPEL